MNYEERLKIAKRERPFKTKVVDGIKMAYRDAREIFDILDEAFPGMWRESVKTIEKKYTLFLVERIQKEGTKKVLLLKRVSDIREKDNIIDIYKDIVETRIITVLEVWNEDIQQWLHYEDIGVESDWSPEKGEISNGVKRVAPHAGVSRDCYTVLKKEKPKSYQIQKQQEQKNTKVIEMNTTNTKSPFTKQEEDIIAALKVFENTILESKNIEFDKSIMGLKQFKQYLIQQMFGCHWKEIKLENIKEVTSDIRSGIDFICETITKYGKDFIASTNSENTKKIFT